MKLIFVILLAALSVSAQDFCVTFNHPTNSAPIKAYELHALGTNGWTGKAWCNASTNKIAFKSWELPSNPCKLAVRSIGFDTNSELSQSIIFDTNDWTNKPTVGFPNPVLPPSFIWVEKL